MKEGGAENVCGLRKGTILEQKAMGGTYFVYTQRVVAAWTVQQGVVTEADRKVAFKSV